MRRSSRHTRSLYAGLSAVVALASLAGCSQGGSGSSAGATSSSPTPETTGDSTTEPTVTTTPTTQSTTAAPTTQPPTTQRPTTQSPATQSPTTNGSTQTDDTSDSSLTRARAAQIGASQLPGLNAQWTWHERSSAEGPGQDIASLCMQASLSAIGAVREQRTDYTSPLSETASAVQMTAVFPDEQTAVTAADVLTAWQTRCAPHASSDLGLQHVTVSAPRDVPTPVGPGADWVISYRPVGGAHSTWTQAEGYVRDTDTITYLVILSAAEHYHERAGVKPIDEALEVAGRYLVQSR